MMIATTPAPTAPPIIAPFPELLFGAGDGIGDELGDADGRYAFICPGERSR
jgi:hypothetical protein